MELDRLQAAARTILMLGAAAVAAACRPQGAPAAKAPAAPLQPPGYQAPPDLLSVGAVQGGRIELRGAAPPGVAVRLATPSGPAGFATADTKGGWRIELPWSAEPRLLGLSVSDKGRVVQAMGYLFIAPDGRTARLRSGGGSEVLGASRGGLGGLAVDYDTERAATLSGDARPGEALSLRVDGVERGQATADAGGRFVMPLNQPLSAGAHDLDLVGASAEVEAHATIRPPARLTGAPFVASRSDSGWRVDWLTPGGGEQTTLILSGASPVS